MGEEWTDLYDCSLRRNGCLPSSVCGIAVEKILHSRSSDNLATILPIHPVDFSGQQILHRLQAPRGNSALSSSASHGENGCSPQQRSLCLRERLLRQWHLVTAPAEVTGRCSAEVHPTEAHTVLCAAACPTSPGWKAISAPRSSRRPSPA